MLCTFILYIYMHTYFIVSFNQEMQIGSKHCICLMSFNLQIFPLFPCNFYVVIFGIEQTEPFYLYGFHGLNFTHSIPVCFFLQVLLSPVLLIHWQFDIGGLIRFKFNFPLLLFLGQKYFMSDTVYFHMETHNTWSSLWLCDINRH